MKNNYYDFAIIIPTLNEEKGICDILLSISDKLNGLSYKIIVVDGDSTDNTAKIAGNMGVKVLTQQKKGYGNALRIGMDWVVKNVNTEIMLFFDADGTYDPNDIPCMINYIQENKAELVTGNRLIVKNRQSMYTTNLIGNHLLSFLFRVVYGISIKDVCSGMKAISCSFYYKLNLIVDGWPLMSEMLAEVWKKDGRIVEVPINYYSRIGESKLPRLSSAYDNVKVICKKRFM